jgi:hypothetical protein
MTTKRTERFRTLAIEVVLGIAIVGSIVAYSLSGMRIGISRNWGAFLGETLIVFINLFAFVRKRTNTAPAYWVAIVALVVHIVAGTVICLYIEDIPLAWFAIAAIAEIVFLLGIVERISWTRIGGSSGSSGSGRAAGH